MSNIGIHPARVDTESAPTAAIEARCLKFRRVAEFSRYAEVCEPGSLFLFSASIIPSAVFIPIPCP